MSRIRFTKTTEPATPPANKSTFYIGTDDHLKRKLDNGTVIDYDLGSSVENIQDVVGAALTDTATIDFTYDDINNEIKADIVAGSVNDTQVGQISPSKIGDAYNSSAEFTVQTTNNVPTQITSLAIDPNTVNMLEVRLVGKVTSGLSLNDSAAFKRTLKIFNNAGTVVIKDTQSDYTSKDQHEFNIIFQTLGSNLIINAQGLSLNNVDWVCMVKNLKI